MAVSASKGTVCTIHEARESPRKTNHETNINDNVNKQTNKQTNKHMNKPGLPCGSMTVTTVAESSTTLVAHRVFHAAHRPLRVATCCNVLHLHGRALLAHRSVPCCARAYVRVGLNGNGPKWEWAQVGMEAASAGKGASAIACSTARTGVSAECCSLWPLGQSAALNIRQTCMRNAGHATRSIACNRTGASCLPVQHRTTQRYVIAASHDNVQGGGVHDWLCI